MNLRVLSHGVPHEVTLRPEHRVVFFREDGKIVAECCETGCVAEGEHETLALHRLVELLETHLVACAEEAHDFYANVDPAAEAAYRTPGPEVLARALLRTAQVSVGPMNLPAGHEGTLTLQPMHHDGRLTLAITWHVRELKEVPRTPAVSG